MTTTIIIVTITAIAILSIITFDALSNIKFPSIRLSKKGVKRGYDRKDREENERIRAEILSRSLSPYQQNRGKK